ncbi:hypothetical protein [Streptomyces sp. NPDC088816]|uniref:hypothetical protein n=1 Tax=Streptomyces sp. NPDC088816 TaxID=3365906 RepID=UPI0037F80A25
MMKRSSPLSPSLCGSHPDAAVQVGREGGEGRLAVGESVEGPEQHRGVPDRRQPLAPDVADEQPGAGAGARRGVQVTADLCLGFGGEVDRGDRQRPDTVRQRSQQDLLRGLGHGART